MAGVDNRALSVMYNGSFLATPGVPAGSTPIWTDFFLTPDNRLLNRTGTVWGSGIAAVGNVQYNTSNGDWTLGVATTSNGVGVIYNGNWLPTPGVPSGSKPVWSDFFLTPDNRLINRTGTVWGTGVATVGRVGYNNSGDWTLGVTTTSNGVGVIYNGNWLPTPGVPSGSKPVWSDFFLTPDNRLINRTGTVWGTGIATVGAVQFDNSGNWTLGVSTTSGGVGVLYNGNWLPISGVPSGSTPVWSDFFLTPDHRLMNRQGTSWAGGIAVVGAVQDNNATGDWTVGLKTDHC
ncbi:hypothetical protein [Microbacterium enclense]|uniref:hypothetical protein n=1 Tax=Microbacterium enclense TaxID=993073 RepID=UPI00342E49CD